MQHGPLHICSSIDVLPAIGLVPKDGRVFRGQVHTNPGSWQAAKQMVLIFDRNSLAW